MMPARVVSLAPALRWEDAMISGNGATGVMVMGRPLDERIVVNHEKLWVVATENAPEAPDLRDAWARARELALEGRYRDANDHARRETRQALRPLLEAEGIPGAARLPYDHIHPGLHMHIETDAWGPVEDYRRETVLDTGEVVVEWRDSRGAWRRRLFVSRTDDVIVLEFTPPAGETMRCRLRLTEAPGKRLGEIGPVTIRHAEHEMYFHAAYARRMGRPEAEGYHALARVLPTGGTAYAISDERVELCDVERVLVLMRLEHLDRAGAADIDSLRSSLAALPADYPSLCDAHAAVHGEMFRRVTLDLGTPVDRARSSEEIIADSEAHGPSPELLEMLHAVGRYAQVSGGTGELPVALSGIWGDTWNPAWDGRYTFDANINLAMSGASQGDLPEVVDAFAGYIERSMKDWSRNARKIFGCRGVLADLCQGWRHGVAIMLYPWVGGAGWLASYLYDHYLYSRDREFLAERVVPLLKEVALFYEDFLAGAEDADGRAVFYPSVSPENTPVIDDPSQASGVVPDATCDIAICREALTNLVAACRELGIEDESVERSRALLARLPDYTINEDGALAEWSYPGLRDRYNHRHSSHLYPLSPSLECSPERTPELFEAVRKAVDKRLEAGLGNKSAHGILHILLVAARLGDPELAWRMLDEFARLRFINSSMITCHNPGLAIFNLDATFTMPAVLMKLLVHSEPGRLELLPALPTDRLLSGTVRGMRARGGVTIEMLHWNMRTRNVTVHLRAAHAHPVVLSCRHRLRSVRPLDLSRDELRISREERGWRIELPADRSVRLRCSV